MKNPTKILKEFYAKFGDLVNSDDKRTRSIVAKVFFDTLLLIEFSGVGLIGMHFVLKAKENKDFANGKYNPSIKEANVLSNNWANIVKVDINGNGKFEKSDFSFFNYENQVPKDVKSFVYIDGVGKKKLLAYKRKNGEYVIFADTFSYLKNSENLNKEFYDYMKDKKVFDLVKAEREIKAHTK